MVGKANCIVPVAGLRIVVIVAFIVFRLTMENVHWLAAMVVFRIVVIVVIVAFVVAVASVIAVVSGIVVGNSHFFVNVVGLRRVTIVVSVFCRIVMEDAHQFVAVVRFRIVVIVVSVVTRVRVGNADWFVPVAATFIKSSCSMPTSNVSTSFASRIVVGGAHWYVAIWVWLASGVVAGHAHRLDAPGVQIPTMFVVVTGTDRDISRTCEIIGWLGCGSFTDVIVVLNLSERCSAAFAQVGETM